MIRWWRLTPPQWDALPESDRHDMEALHYLDSLKCPGGCGNYVDEAHTRDWNWDVEHHKCFACAANDLVQRDFQKKNKNVESAADGLLWTVTPVAPKPKP